MNKSVAIVGAQELTRDKAPWDDKTTDIWVFNEFGMSDWVKRWDAVIQIHDYSHYANPNRNPATPRPPGYVDWLHKKHGKPIYMQNVENDIPDSKKYPLAEINKRFLSTLTFEDQEVTNFRATVSYAIALALYQEYEHIHLYGVELYSNTQYRSQKDNLAFWVGVATGMKVKFTLHCTRRLFDRPMYGFDYGFDDDYECKLRDYLIGLGQQKTEKNKEYMQLDGAVILANQILNDKELTLDEKTSQRIKEYISGVTKQRETAKQEYHEIVGALQLTEQILGEKHEDKTS